MCVYIICTTVLEKRYVYTQVEIIMDSAARRPPGQVIERFEPGWSSSSGHALRSPILTAMIATLEPLHNLCSFLVKLQHLSNKASSTFIFFRQSAPLAQHCHTYFAHEKQIFSQLAACCYQ